MSFISKRGDLCCQFCNRHDFRIHSETCFPFRGSWLVHFLFQGLEFLAFVRLNTLTYEWSLGSPVRANQKPRILDPSNQGRSLRSSSQSAPGAFIQDFPVVFHSQKEREGKLEKKTSIHKNLPWHDSPDMFFFFRLCLLHFTSLSFYFWQEDLQEL